MTAAAHVQVPGQTESAFLGTRHVPQPSDALRGVRVRRNIRINAWPENGLAIINELAGAVCVPAGSGRAWAH